MVALEYNEDIEHLLQTRLLLWVPQEAEVKNALDIWNLLGENLWGKAGSAWHHNADLNLLKEREKDNWVEESKIALRKFYKANRESSRQSLLK